MGKLSDDALNDIDVLLGKSTPPGQIDPASLTKSVQTVFAGLGSKKAKAKLTSIAASDAIETEREESRRSIKPPSSDVRCSVCRVLLVQAKDDRWMDGNGSSICGSMLSRHTPKEDKQ